MKNEISIVLLGDSITQGIGTRRINYENDLKKYLLNKGIKCEVVNLALTGTTIEYAMTQIPIIEEIKPDYVIIMYGSVDLQIRPNMETNKFGILSLTPKRYKNIKGMLNPRPFMSSHRGRYLLDCMDNLYRKIWKQVVVVTQGTMQYLTEEEFERTYRKVLCSLKSYKVICCSTMYVDSAIYTKKTLCNYKRANDFLVKAVSEYVNVKKLIDLYGIQQEIVYNNGYKRIYYMDHFHPNQFGCHIIAEHIGRAISMDMGYEEAVTV